MADLGDDLRLRHIRQTRQPEQHNSGMGSPLPEYQFAEVLVRREQQRTSVVGLLEDLLISSTGGHIGHIEYVVAITPESFHHRAIHAFIRQQVHAECVPTG